ncbi:MAG: uroporphyrinogen decarboxylase family protein, partial [Armatimonadota bacterium]
PDRFLSANIGAPFAQFAYSLGFEPALLLLHDNPSLCSYLLERILEPLPRDCAQLAACGFDGAVMVDSWASADIMSPQTYVDRVAPFHKMVSDELHSAGLKSIYWNTGNILPMLDTIAQMGYDAVNPEERIKGVEIDIGEVRKGLGPDACIIGNFDAYLLLSGDRDEIRREVHRQISLAGPERFIMGTGSPVCDGTDPDVLDFWMDEVRG